MRQSRQRHYLMCRPTYFDVNYSINPWMNPDKPVDTRLAIAQWEWLYELYNELGHHVELIEPLPDLPDMVFAANGASVVDGRVLVSRFRYPERAAEAAAYVRWFETNSYGDVHRASWHNEGEGDLLVLGARILAGSGFRTDPGAHGEAQELLGRPVLGLTLVDPTYYHLNMAMAVLDDEEIMYYPAAFSPESQAVLRELYADAIMADDADAAVLGLNAVSDGRHVVLPAAATRLTAQLRERGYEPIGADLSELFKAGGSVKCCTLELRSGAFGSSPTTREQQ